MDSIRPTRSHDSMSCFQGVTCIQRTRFALLLTIRPLLKSLSQGGTESPMAGHSLVVRWRAVHLDHAIVERDHAVGELGFAEAGARGDGIDVGLDGKVVTV